MRRGWLRICWRAGPPPGRRVPRLLDLSPDGERGCVTALEEGKPLSPAGRGRAARGSGRPGEGTPGRTPIRKATPRSILLAALLTLAATAAVAQDHPRIVSINLCTDQLLLSLADPGQVLGLSPYARDAARSWAAARAAAFPVLSGTAEEILALRPDLVVAGRFTKRATRELVRAQGFRLVEFDAPRSIAQAKTQIAQMGDLVGHPDRAQVEVARIDAAIARARGAAARRPLSVLPLQRRGWISGGETLMTSLLATVGLTNAGAELSRGLGRQVSLEAIVRLAPDLLLLSGAGERAEDQGSALLQHPALRRLHASTGRLTLPERLTVCGGPMLADAIDLLAAEVERR